MFKQYLPHSLFGRFLLIILVPSILVQIVAIYMFYERHWSSVSRHIERSLAGDIVMLTKSLQDTSPHEREDIIDIAKNALYLNANFVEGERLSTTPKTMPEFDILSSDLALKLNLPYSMYYAQDDSILAVDIELDNGVLHIEAPRKRLVNPSTYIFILWMSGTAILLVLVSILFMRNQVRSIARLADSAEKLGKGLEVENFKPSGATEIRKASEAFLKMKDRLNRQIEQRTEMLAGVSHDLKTPLTRIKLQLALMPESDTIRELHADVTEMEKMVQGYLDFAKGKEHAPTGPTNVSELLRSILAGYRNQSEHIVAHIQPNITLSLNANAFRRSITNLVDNALRYGRNVELTAHSKDHIVTITIDDDGPGIPESKRQLVFKPFYRLEQSRNRDTGGTGLGLSIAKDVIMGYGGDIMLDTSPMGGLRASITLPM